MATYVRSLCSYINASKSIIRIPISSCTKKYTEIKDVLHPNSFLTKSNGLPSLRFYSSGAQVAEDNDENSEKIKEDKPSRPVVDVETSKRYLKSDSYNKTYNGALVWQPYRRNHKGHLPPKKIRRSCYVGGRLRTGNPCPICRDEYLVLHPENVDLLKQFVSPYTGEVIPNRVTNLCHVQHKKLLISIEQAWDLGNIEKAVPFREYKYEDYYPQLKKTNNDGS